MNYLKKLNITRADELQNYVINYENYIIKKFD